MFNKVVNKVHLIKLLNVFPKSSILKAISKSPDFLILLLGQDVKVKFDGNKNISFDSIQLLFQSIEEKLGNDGIYENLYNVEDSN